MTRRKRHQLRCQCCGLLFPSMHPTAKWCSNACTQHAFRQRRKAAALAVHSMVIQNQDDLPTSWRDGFSSQGLDHRIWNGTTIERRRSDGYINATAMAKANGKHLPHYMANERTREYMQALADLAGISIGRVAQIITTGPNDLRGTWIHPRLAVDLARWISPVFAVWMDGWFLECISQSQSATQCSPQLPALPPSSPAILIRASSDREAAQAWCDAVEATVSSAIRRRLSPAHRDDSAIPMSSHWRRMPA